MARWIWRCGMVALSAVPDEHVRERNQGLLSVMPWVVSLSKRFARGYGCEWWDIRDRAVEMLLRYEHDPARGKWTTFAFHVTRTAADQLRRERDADCRRVNEVALRVGQHLSGDGSSLLDDVAGRDDEPVEDAGRREMAERVRAAVATLTGRDRRIITRRFGLDGAAPCTQLELAAEYGLTRARIAQIEERALARLAAALRPVAAN